MANRYWANAVGGIWSDTNMWSATSGGATGASAPTLADFAFFDQAGTYTVTGQFQILGLTVSAGLVTFNLTNVTIAGTAATTFFLGAGNVASWTSTNLQFGTGAGQTLTVTTNGLTLNITGNLATQFNTNSAFTGTILLAGDLTFNAPYGFYFAYGTLNLNNYKLTVSQFFGKTTGGISGTRTIAYGTGNITLDGTGIATTGNTVIYDAGATNNPTNTGTPTINVTYAGSTAISLTLFSAAETAAISFNFTAGSYALAFLTSGISAKNVTFGSGFTGSWTLASGALLYGSLTLSANMANLTTSTSMNFSSTTGTSTIRSNGKTIDAPITFNGATGYWQLLDNMTVGITRTVAFSAGTLDLNNNVLTTGLFNSSITNVRTIAFGTSGAITCYGLSGTIFTTATMTNLTITGTSTVNISSAATTGAAITVAGSNPAEAQALSFNITSGSYTLTMLSLNRNYKNVNFQSGFTGTLVAPGSSVIIYGNLTFSSGMTIAAGGGPVTFGGTTTGKTITSNTKVLGFGVIFDGVGASWILQDAMAFSVGTITHTNGTIDLNGRNLTTAAVASGYTTGIGTKNLTFNGGSLVCQYGSSNAFNNGNPTGFSTTAGTGTGVISMTGTTAKTFTGGGSTFNCTVSNDGAGSLTIDGTNTFTGVRNAIASSAVVFNAGNTIGTLSNTVVPCTFTFAAGSTQTITSWSVSGTAAGQVTINSTSAATHTLVKVGTGIVSADYLTISNSSATPSTLTWYAGTNSTNVTGNTGWIFTAPPSTGNTGAFFFMF